MCSYRVVFLEADRDIPDFAIGAKWSTDYGPSVSASVGDFSVFTQGTFITHSTSARDQILHSGFDETRIVVSKTKATQGLTLLTQSTSSATAALVLDKNRRSFRTGKTVSKSYVTKLNQFPQFKPI